MRTLHRLAATQTLSAVFAKRKSPWGFFWLALTALMQVFHRNTVVSLELLKSGRYLYFYTSSHRFKTKNFINI